MQEVNHQEYKKWLYRLPQSQNNCTEEPTLIRNFVNRIEVKLGGLKLL
jgi:hypothetical protein